MSYYSGRHRSRSGGGIKAVGLNGKIVDTSIYNEMEARFEKVVKVENVEIENK